MHLVRVHLKSNIENFTCYLRRRCSNIQFRFCKNEKRLLAFAEFGNIWQHVDTLDSVRCRIHQVNVGGMLDEWSLKKPDFHNELTMNVSQSSANLLIWWNSLKISSQQNCQEELLKSWVLNSLECVNLVEISKSYNCFLIFSFSLSPSVQLLHAYSYANVGFDTENEPSKSLYTGHTFHRYLGSIPCLQPSIGRGRR